MALPKFGVNNYKKQTRRKRKDQDGTQSDQTNILKILRGKNIEDKEDNYGYNNKSNITDRCG